MPNRRKFTPMRMPLETHLRRWRFGLPAVDSESQSNLTVETARGAIHGRIPRTRGYIKPSSVDIIETHRVKQDLQDPNSHVAFNNPVFRNTLEHLREGHELPRRTQRLMDPMGMTYSNRQDIADLRPPQNRQMRTILPSAKGTIRGPTVTSKRLGEYFEERVLGRQFHKAMSQLRNNPDIYNQLRRGDRSGYDELWRRIRNPEDRD